MKTEDAYNNWAGTYDTMINKTRDLEAFVKKQVLAEALQLKAGRVLELGCGTGKNTSWLAEHCTHLTAVDFSAAMIAQAKEKNKYPHVNFVQADITQPWPFETADLITCSLILEHIEDLHFIFQQASNILNPGGIFYICELHPYKQLQGSRAKFETGEGTVELEYFIHHLSEFFQAAKATGFACTDMQEWFDNEERNTVPRLCSFVFKRM